MTGRPTLYHKAMLRIHDLIVDENNRLLEIAEISDALKDNSGYEYKNAYVLPYVNQSGIVYLSSKVSITDNGNIIIQSGGDVNINNSSLINTSEIALSILQNIDLKSAWVATKNDLYQLFDYEKYEDMVVAVDKHFSGQEIKKAKFETFANEAKGIASVLGSFGGAILSELAKK